MEHPITSERQILDEDLQIIRVTLATIVNDVRHFSARAADAVQEALVKLNAAQEAFSHAGESHSRRRGPRIARGSPAGR